MLTSVNYIYRAYSAENNHMPVKKYEVLFVQISDHTYTSLCTIFVAESSNCRFALFLQVMGSSGLQQLKSTYISFC